MRPRSCFITDLAAQETEGMILIGWRTVRPNWRLRCCSITDSAAKETDRMILIGWRIVDQSGGSGPVPSPTQLHKKQKEWFSLVGVKWTNQEAQVLFHHRLSCTRNRRNDSHWLLYSGLIRRLRSCSITDSAAQETVTMILIGGPFSRPIRGLRSCSITGSVAQETERWFSLVGVQWANQEAQVLFHHRLSFTRNR